jgi:hypothetical protein
LKRPFADRQPGPRRRAISKRVVSLRPARVPTSEEALASMISNLKRESVDAVEELFELIFSIVQLSAGPNLDAPELEGQVEDLTSIVLDVIFSGTLRHPSELPYLIRTLSSSWNRTAVQTRHQTETSGPKSGKVIPFVSLQPAE